MTGSTVSQVTTLSRGRGPVPDISDLLQGAVSPAENTFVEQVLNALEAHETGEEEAVETYTRMAEGRDPIVAFLMRMVVEDEERHHALIARMVQRLRDDLTWSHSPDALPAARADAETAPISADAARALADEERQGAHQLRMLARDVAGMHDGLLALLLKTVALDNEKHEHVLRFVAKRIEGTT